MTDFKRYAIYFTLPGGGLADFGARWLGWDSAQGRNLPHPDIVGLDVANLTATPRKYGVHATIKPPFRLAPGTDCVGLTDALHHFCAGVAPVRLDGMTLSQIGRFFALTPLGDQSGLTKLAADTVRVLDPFRAPLTEAELARRRKSRLTPRQEALLTHWGYPYVCEEFRFHITLTGPVARPDAGAVQTALTAALSGLLPAPFTLDALSLVGEDAEGRFHVLTRVPLTGDQ